MLGTALAGVGVSIAIPLTIKALIDGPITNHEIEGVLPLGLLVMALGVLEAVLIFWRRWVQSNAVLQIETAMRHDLYARLQVLPMSFHTKWGSGQLLSRATTDLSAIRRFAGFGLLFLIINILQLVVVTGVLLHMYWPLGLVVALTAAPIVWLSMRFEKGYVVLSRRVQDEQGDLATRAEEGAVGIRVIKAFGRSDHVAGQYDTAATKLQATSMDKVRLSARFWTFLEVIPNLAVVVVLLLGAIGVGRGALTPGELVAFITLMLSLVWPVASLGVILAMAQEAMTAAARILEIFDTEPDIVDGPHLTTAADGGHLCFEHVDFAFPDEPDKLVLRDVNLELLPGETVALVGATGSGKTMLTALVPRLYDVTAGRITLDGVDIRDLTLGKLRSLVATAFEEPTLFSMSARENLTLGRSDASDAEVAEALVDRPGRLRQRPALGSRHPHRRAGHVALRRPATAPRAGPRRPRPAPRPGPRRHPVRPRHPHREARRGGAAPCAVRDDRPDRRPPRLDRDARRPGGAAPGRHHHPRRRAPRAARHGAGLSRAARRRRARGGGVRMITPRRRSLPRFAPPLTTPQGPRMSTTQTPPPLSTTTSSPSSADDPVQAWRGVAADGHADSLTEETSARLAVRSRRLLADLLRPYARVLKWLIVIVVVENAARLSIPYLVKVGIDSGIPPIQESNDLEPLLLIVGAMLVATIVQAITRQLFLVRSGTIGQDLLFEIRHRVFRHFQRLSPAFHDDYTSGRVISRQTSDVDAIYEMLESGFDGLVTAALTLVGTAALLLFLDVKLGLVALLCGPFLAWLTNWFRKSSAKSYRVTREKVALVIVHFVESMGGIRAVQAFRREPRNQEIFDDVNEQYRAANLVAFRLVAWFMPGIRLIGNITIGVVLLYGGYRAFHGDVTVGVLAAFLLYLRQFFEPMMEISQFYNTFQSASAALEKLSGVLEEEPSVAEPDPSGRAARPPG